MAHILILYRLKDGVTRQDFEHWLEKSSAPVLRGIRRLKSFQVYRAEKRVMGSGAPSEALSRCGCTSTSPEKAPT